MSEPQNSQLSLKHRQYTVYINPHLPRVGGYHPLMICHRTHQNAKQSDPGHLSNLFYILWVILMKTIRWYTLTRGRVSRQSPKVRGVWLPHENILSPHFEKNICMIWTLNLQNMFETPFPFFISKNRVKYRYLELLSEKINFGLYFSENQHFQVGHI